MQSTTWPTSASAYTQLPTQAHRVQAPLQDHQRALVQGRLRAMAQLPGLQAGPANVDGARTRARLGEVEHFAATGEAQGADTLDMAMAFVGGGEPALARWEPTWPFSPSTFDQAKRHYAGLAQKDLRKLCAERPSLESGLRAVGALCNGQGLSELTKQGLRPGLASAYVCAFVEGGLKGLWLATCFLAGAPPRPHGAPPPPTAQSAQSAVEPPLPQQLQPRPVPRAQEELAEVRAGKRRALTPQPPEAGPLAKRVQLQAAPAPRATSSQPASPGTQGRRPVPALPTTSAASLGAPSPTSTADSSSARWTTASSAVPAASSATSASGTRMAEAEAVAPPSPAELELRGQNPVPLCAVTWGTSALVPRSYLMALLTCPMPAVLAEHLLPVKVGDTTRYVRFAAMHAWLHPKPVAAP